MGPNLKAAPNSTAAAVAALCPQCGLCCNGVLFGDVELQSGDNARRLRSLGVELFRKGRKPAIHQPCSCLVNGLCRIYADRPARCRTFDCGLVKRVASGKLETDDALKSITAARHEVKSITQLVQQLGPDDASLPLKERCAAAMVQPVDLASGAKHLRAQGRLLRAVARLSTRLERDFLT